MNKFKTISLTIVFFLLMTVPALAAPIENPVSDKYSDLAKIINSMMGWVRALAVIGLLAYTSYGGYTKLSAGGDPEKDKKAMMIIRSGLIGFLIILIAPFIVRTVGALFGVSTL